MPFPFVGAAAADPRAPDAVPKALTEDEVSALLAAAVSSEPRGYRDRAILELFYASGLRLSELAGADLEDINLSALEMVMLAFLRRLRAGEGEDGA